MRELAVALVAAVGVNGALYLVVDAERDPVAILAEQEALWREHRAGFVDSGRIPFSAYYEEYTSSRFWDFERHGWAHPLLLEYAAAFHDCDVDPEDFVGFVAVVHASGRAGRLEATGPDAPCTQRALQSIPFGSLAPPSGSLVLSGHIRGADLDPYQPPDTVFNARRIQPEVQSIWYQAGFGEPFYFNGEAGDQPAMLSEEAQVAINDWLTCPSPYEWTRVEASVTAPFGTRARVVVSTSPDVPCVSAKLQERWHELPEAVFGAQGSFQSVGLGFNVLLQPPEGSP